MMEKYNELSGAGVCEFDTYGNELQDTPGEIFSTGMFPHNDYHNYNPAPYGALNGVYYQTNNQQQNRNHVLNHSQMPVTQQQPHLQQLHRQQLVVGSGGGGDDGGGLYSERAQQRQQNQTNFLATNRGVVVHPEAGQRQEPHLTSHYAQATTTETDLQITERQYRLIRAQNTQPLQRTPNTMASGRLRQFKQQHHELDYQQQQQPQCYADQAGGGYELHHVAFNGFSAGNFPGQQVMVDDYASGTNPYRRHDDVNLITNDLTAVAGGSLVHDNTATNHEQQQRILFGLGQSQPFGENNSNDCHNFPMQPPHPSSLTDDGGNLTVGGGGQAQNYYSQCEFVDGETVNPSAIASVLEIDQQQVVRPTGASLSANLDGQQKFLDTEKSVYTSGGIQSELDDQTHQARHYSFEQYSSADQQQSIEQTTTHDQSPAIKSDYQTMNHRLGAGRSSARVPATIQRDYIDMRSSGNLSQEWLDTICRHMIKHMDSFGICVIDNFLGSIKGELILDEVKQLFSNRRYSTGRLMNDKLDSGSGDVPGLNDPAKTIRNDRVIWVDGCEEGCEEINNLIQTLCSVITNSSRLSLYSNNSLDKVVISKRTKAHVACYPGQGTRYIKHVDNPNGDGRVITAIYYLNKSWSTKQDGGLLRMFPAGVETVANIEPLFDRVLFFWSDRRNPHEVLPAYRDRYAITVWYIGDNRSQET